MLLGTSSQRAWCIFRRWLSTSILLSRAGTEGGYGNECQYGGFWLHQKSIRCGSLQFKWTGDPQVLKKNIAKGGKSCWLIINYLQRVRKELSFLHEVIWSNPKLHRNIFDRETTIAEADVEPSQMYNLTQQEASQVELKKNCSALWQSITSWPWCVALH